MVERREERQRIEKGSRERREIERKETTEMTIRREPLVVVQLPQGTAFFSCFPLDSAVKSGFVKGLAQRD